MSRARIEVPQELIAAFCLRHHIRRLALFGSVLRDDFSPESDVDILVEFQPGKTPGFAFFGMQDELSAIFHRRVDLRTPNELSKYFKDEVLAEAEQIYGNVPGTGDPSVSDAEQPGVTGSERRAGAAGTRIDVPRTAIEALCKRHRIRRLALFGSVLREDFRPDSDVDVLAEFEPGQRITYFTLVEVESDLSAAFGRKVDLHMPGMLHPMLRDRVTGQAEAIYVAA